MYWPIGTPKVYALSKHVSSHTQITRTHDGVNNGAESSELLSSNNNNGLSALSEEANLGSSSRTVSEDTATQNGEANGGTDIFNRESEILAAKVSRGGGIFATITPSTLTIWQSKPVVALASVIRSARSMKAYGPNSGLILRPDALIVVVQTSDGYLITYSLETDPNARVYTTQLPPTSNRHARKDSIDGYNFRRPNSTVADAGPGEGDGIREISVRFRMVIRIDAGISKAIALDDELVIATQEPAALQCIHWVSENSRTKTSTEVLSRISWVANNCAVIEMVHDRPMNLTCWITSDGRVYAVQRRSAANVDMDNPASLFQGFCFREPETEDTVAVKAAINARFSLIAVGCANGNIDIYTVKDYMGNIPHSHRLQLSISSSQSGRLTFLTYSVDGYCLFAGYEKGWAIWSVYGKPGANSFSTDVALAKANEEGWLCGVRDAFWLGGGSELVIVGPGDDRIFVLEIARNAITGCYSPASISRGLLQSSTSVMLYKGHEISDLTAVPSDMSLWQTVQIPAIYLLHQWPIKLAVVSPDAKYIAVAGRRGLAHYSTISGRWRTSDDFRAEHEFAVRGGMCWYQHFLIACVEVASRHQIRVYSREKALDHSHIQYIEDLSAPAIFVTVTGTDSLLVYSNDNTLLHFIIIPSNSSIKLVQVGQIGFHGIIRAPPRVRAISWVLPEDQLEHGDPSQDVATASVIFLVDGKLVLLQPSTNEQGELKYDMRVIAQNVEYYTLLRDNATMMSGSKGVEPMTPTVNGLPVVDPLDHSLRDSLWYFDGSGFHVWLDIQDVLASAPAELGRDLPPTVRVPVDFYPLSVLLEKGIINGIDADLSQRRDVNFSFFRHSARTQLFLPQLLRYHLAEYNSPAALHLSHSYQKLPYFAHALEILLHDILDNEVDNPPSPPEAALLPTATSFLSSFPSYLDIIVNCTRKTELRSWRTLFSYLPPAMELFEHSIAQQKLKTAAGYLLVLHTLDEEEFQVGEFARLLQRAAGEQDWELCRELCRFLVGIDSTGQTLRAALADAGLDRSSIANHGSLDGVVNGAREGTRASSTASLNSVSQVSGTTQQSSIHTNGIVDYFSLRRKDNG